MARRRPKLLSHDEVGPRTGEVSLGRIAFLDQVERGDLYLGGDVDRAAAGKRKRVRKVTTGADTRLFAVIAERVSRGHYMISRKVTTYLSSIMPTGFDASEADEKTILSTITEVIRLHSGSTSAGCSLESRKHHASFNATLGGILVKALTQAETRENEP